MVEILELHREACKGYLLASEGEGAVIDPLLDKVDRFLSVLGYDGDARAQFASLRRLLELPTETALWRELPGRAEQELPEDRLIVAICRSGGRSATAAALLTGLGYASAYNLDGGMVAWVDRGGPMEGR